MASLKQSHNLLYFTASYPYGKGEQFIANEIEGLANKFDKVFVVPFDLSKAGLRLLPSNCELLDLRKNGEDLNVNIRYWFLFKVLISEIVFSKKRFFILRKFRFFFSYLKQSDLWAGNIESYLNKNVGDSETVEFYSTWMNECTLSLALLKKSKRIQRFSFKMRGYDLFDERREQGYMPFRRFIFKQAKSILTMSKQGAEYLKEKKIYSGKISHNYPGIETYGKNELKQGVFTLVSCSGLVKLKRVDTIAKALSYIDFEMKWIHFGDGPEKQLIEEIVKKLPGNITVQLKGNIENESIRQFYINEKIDGFIHVSETEGFGYAIIEAYCSAIPSILYPAGGVTELIGEDFSHKVSTPLTPKSLAKDIRVFKEKFDGNSKAKECAFNFYIDNFQVDPNVDELFSFIID